MISERTLAEVALVAAADEMKAIREEIADTIRSLELLVVIHQNALRNARTLEDFQAAKAIRKEQDQLWDKYHEYWHVYEASAKRLEAASRRFEAAS